MSRKSKYYSLVSLLFYSSVVLLVLTIIFSNRIFLIDRNYNDSVDSYELILLDQTRRVIDGDTIEYKNITYRELFIDSPEKTTNQKDRWLGYNLDPNCMRIFGIRAYEYLNRTVYTIKIPKVGTTIPRDKYDRILGIFLDSNMSIIGLNMVREGLAFCFYRHDSIHRLEHPELIRIAEECLRNENYARANRLGVWGC
ncbi:MAG: thermonuclease family protein [Candidatus Anstonellales archaeon]